ncbi:MAG: hypothetical protein BGO69_05715 [Bacteroidetes bacterium 46-16]|nr:MAG: hypothetical protein BGO69_05715 [Bacteroidetes bacterium 46-16]
MNGYPKLITAACFFTAAALAFASCKKDNTGTEQAIYTITNVNSPEPGTILVSPYNTSSQDKGSLIIMDNEGNIISQKTTNGAAFCFKKWNINGQVRYSFIINDVNQYHIPSVNQLTGYVVVTDSALNELQRIDLKAYGAINTTSVNLDVHDFILLADDDYITMSYYPMQADNIPDSLHPSAGVTIICPVIQEVKNGSVVWQWLGSDHPEFYANSVEGNNFSDTSVAQDYMHMNSMIIDPRDNDLICSFRNQDQVIKIDRETGNIVWRLGGKNSDFVLNDNELFLRQHNATLADNNQTLMLFDNGDKTLRAQSRVIEFQLDENAKTVNSFKAYNIPEPFSQYMGSVQKINDKYFIGGGTGNYVVEINPATGAKSFEMTSNETTYRAYKYP